MMDGKGNMGYTEGFFFAFIVFFLVTPSLLSCVSFSLCVFFFLHAFATVDRTPSFLGSLMW